MKVHPQTLEVRIKHTSSPAAVPKGLFQVPRDQLAVLSARWKRRWARAILTPGMLFGVPLLLGVAHVGGDTTVEALGQAGATTLWVGTGVAGYMIGDRIDRRRMQIVLLPDGASR